MDLAPFLPWLVFLHIAGAFGLVLAHGVSVFAAFAIRGTRDRTRIVSLLELSGVSLGLLYISLLLLLVGGVLAGIAAGWYTSGRMWIWAALILLVLIVVAMYAMASRYYAAVRAAVGLRSTSVPKEAPDPTPLGDQELDALLRTNRPEQLAAIGGVGFLLILYLMVFKPF
ncbi:MAG TPA: hypothetical protein VH720_10260 [Candidatus Limnocylindrales bacterium]|jgi:hypothetical protein